MSTDSSKVTCSLSVVSLPPSCPMRGSQHISTRIGSCRQRPWWLRQRPAPRSSHMAAAFRAARRHCKASPEPTARRLSNGCLRSAAVQRATTCPCIVGLLVCYFDCLLSRLSSPPSPFSLYLCVCRLHLYLSHFLYFLPCLFARAFASSLFQREPRSLRPLVVLLH